MARRTRPPQSTPPPSDDDPSDLSSWDEELPLGPGESRPDPVPEDLTESTAFVLMSGSVDGCPPGPGESRPDPVPEDLPESTALVVITAAAADRRLARFGVRRVLVRVRKDNLPLGGGAVEVELERHER